MAHGAPTKRTACDAACNPAGSARTILMHPGRGRATGWPVLRMGSGRAATRWGAVRRCGRDLVLGRRCLYLRVVVGGMLVRLQSTGSHARPLLRPYIILKVDIHPFDVILATLEALHFIRPHSA